MIRKLLKDTGFYAGADALGRFASFPAYPVIAAALDPKSFGSLESILICTGLLEENQWGQAVRQGPFVRIFDRRDFVEWMKAHAA